MSKKTSNEEKIKEAMQRLLAGNSLHTDGKLHVSNLAKEAGLTRQQVYRSEAVEAFKEHVKRLEETEDHPAEKNLATIEKLRKALAEEKQRSTKYRQERDQAKEENKVLAQELLLLDKQLNES